MCGPTLNVGNDRLKLPQIQEEVRLPGRLLLSGLRHRQFAVVVKAAGDLFLVEGDELFRSRLATVRVFDRMDDMGPDVGENCIYLRLILNVWLRRAVALHGVNQEGSGTPDFIDRLMVG